MGLPGAGVAPVPGRALRWVMPAIMSRVLLCVQGGYAGDLPGTRSSTIPPHCELSTIPRRLVHILKNISHAPDIRPLTIITGARHSTSP